MLGFEHILIVFFLVDHAAADVLLWRNKKISLSVLSAATAVWVLFEWLNYHFLTLVCFVLVIGMFVQFVWSNASGVLNRCSFEEFNLSSNLICTKMLWYLLDVPLRQVPLHHTGHHLKYPALFYQRRYLLTLVLPSVLKLTVSWDSFKIFLLEET